MVLPVGTWLDVVVLNFNYKTMKALQTQTGIEISTLQSFYGISQPVKAASYLILWSKEGSGSITLDTEHHSLINDTIYCIRPGQLYSLDAGFNATGYIIAFSAFFLFPLGENTQLLKNSGLFDVKGSNPVIVSDDDKQFEHLLLDIVKEYSGSNATYKLEVLRALIKVLVIQLSRSLELFDTAATVQDDDADFVNTFLEMVENNFLQMKKVSDYAAMLCIAPNYLNIKVKKVSGHTASYHIQQCILMEAKRKAKWEGMGLKQIAYHLGYDDIAHFSKFFKKTAGISFSGFKKTAYAMI